MALRVFVEGKVARFGSEREAIVMGGNGVFPPAV
jgi:hypothetical protein